MFLDENLTRLGVDPLPLKKLVMGIQFSLVFLMVKLKAGMEQLLPIRDLPVKRFWFLGET